MIVIVNYGLGNLGSIKNMLKRVGVEASICDNPSKLEEATKIILPGVGAFDTGMRHLGDNGWLEILNRKVLLEKVPTLGICLGMQLMTKRSEEGQLPGLGWINGEVLKFTDPALRVPHMGWNVVHPGKQGSILATDRELRFYFVHSYYVTIKNEEEILGKTIYGTDFVSAFVRDNIYGVQFHPEKSHQFGMELFRKFAVI